MKTAIASLAACRQESGRRSAKVSRFGRPRAIKKTNPRMIANRISSLAAVEYW